MRGLLAVVTVLVFTASAEAQALRTERLDNGLTVIVRENQLAPVVAINLWVRAGYFDEEDREVGISHVIEHMFFKGTSERPRPDQIANEIK